MNMALYRKRFDEAAIPADMGRVLSVDEVAALANSGRVTDIRSIPAERNRSRVCYPLEYRLRRPFR